MDTTNKKYIIDLLDKRRRKLMLEKSSLYNKINYSNKKKYQNIIREILIIVGCLNDLGEKKVYTKLKSKVL